MSTTERDYILGTHDEELERLGLQHRVWRPYTTDAWQPAGFASGQTIMDVGCGPGYASLDLAEVVGPKGRVLAFDRSRRFLDALESRARARGIGQIAATELDLELSPLPYAFADGGWCGWVFAFLKDPRALLRRVAGSMKRGGVIVIHEYLDYSAFRLAPRSEEFEEFVRFVIKSWRDTGGEPDIGVDLPGWLEDEGFEIRSLRPIMNVVSPSNHIWEWPAAFVQVGLARLVELKLLPQSRADAILADFRRREADPNTRMITPIVLEMIAHKK